MIVAYLAALPRWVRIAAIALAVAALTLIVHRCAVQSAVEADRAERAAEALEKARGADAVAAGRIEATRDEVERKNAQVREAASGSADPLKRGFDCLRAGAGACPPAR